MSLNKNMFISILEALFHDYLNYTATKSVKIKEF